MPMAMKTTATAIQNLASRLSFMGLAPAHAGRG